MREREQGSGERGWSIAADLGIAAIAVVTLTMAAMKHQPRTYHEPIGDDSIQQAWQAGYHIQTTTPVPIPTGWRHKARPVSETLQWDCELIDVDAIQGVRQKNPTSRATHQGNRSYLRVYRPETDNDGIVLCGHPVDRGRRRMDAAK